MEAHAPEFPVGMGSHGMEVYWDRLGDVVAKRWPFPSPSELLPCWLRAVSLLRASLALVSCYLA